MAKFIEWFKFIFSAVATTLSYVFGGWDNLFIALLIVMAIDYISGVLVAIVNKKISSAVGFKGLFKKCLILCLVACGVLVDRVLELDNGICRMLVIYFYIANEGISVIENAGNLGLPIPQALKDAFVQIKDRTGTTVVKTEVKAEEPKEVVTEQPKEETTENKSEETTN